MPGYKSLNYRLLKKESRGLSGGGTGGVPQIQKSPKIGGFRGLKGTISAFSIADYSLPSLINVIPDLFRNPTDA
jgi:hypothetical protein